jgi:hypothetical protein
MPVALDRMLRKESIYPNIQIILLSLSIGLFIVFLPTLRTLVVEEGILCSKENILLLIEHVLNLISISSGLVHLRFGQIVRSTTKRYSVFKAAFLLIAYLRLRTR